MGSVLPFRRLRWGPQQRLPTPYFLRQRRSRFAGLRNPYGFLALAAMMAVAAFQLEPWHGTARTMDGLRVTVVDGDSLRAGKENIRLIGIDALELHQTCRDARGGDWACGREAKARLAALVSGGNVACTERGRDRYGRTLAVCQADGIADLGAALVREGHAVDYGGYADAEREARQARRGLWDGSFERPQDWRRRHPRSG
jgi:endonuclease YncB( thermonuclease family)